MVQVEDSKTAVRSELQYSSINVYATANQRYRWSPQIKEVVKSKMAALQSTTVLTPIVIGGDLKLKNRIALAPLTRARSHADGIPKDHNVEYYVQRGKSRDLLCTNRCRSKRTIWSLNITSFCSTFCSFRWSPHL